MGRQRRGADKTRVSRLAQRRPAMPKRARGVAAWIIGALGIAFACLCYAYLTLPDVRTLSTSNPTTTAFMDIREDEAHDSGKPARKDQRWVGYSRISPNLKRAVLVAEDSAFWQHEGVDFAELQKSIE